MFNLSDLRKTRVYQEALEEGIEQGIKLGIEQGIEQGIKRGIERGIEQGRMQWKLAAIPRLLALGLNLEQIAQALDLDIEQVQRTITDN